MKYEKKPASGIVLEKIRDRIVTGEYPPNMMLLEKDICEEFGVSRTPYREALKKLEELTLVTVVPRFGTYVSEIDLNLVRQAFEIRLELESLSCRLAAKRRTPAQAETMVKMMEESKSILESGDLDKGAVKDREFHQFVCVLAQNPLLETYREELHNICSRVFSPAIREKFNAAEFIEQHHLITQAIIDQDEISAGKHVLEHIQYSIEVFKDSLFF